MTTLLGFHSLSLFLNGLESWRQAGVAVSVGGMPADVEKRLPPLEQVARLIKSAEASLPTTAVRAEAALSVGFALLAVYAVAAVVTRSKGARRAMLIVGAAGIVVNLTAALYQVLIVRPVIATVMPQWVEVMMAASATTAIEAGAAAAPSPGELISAASKGYLVYIGLQAAAGIGFSILILWFFGGRRGRSVFGKPNATAVVDV